jgi:DNA-binding protein YbaB
MRHVKLRSGRPLDAEALEHLIAAAYRDARSKADSSWSP